MTDLLNRLGAARILGCSPSDVWHLAREGRLGGLCAQGGPYGSEDATARRLDLGVLRPTTGTRCDKGGSAVWSGLRRAAGREPWWRGGCTLPTADPGLEVAHTSLKSSDGGNSEIPRLSTFEGTDGKARSATVRPRATFFPNVRDIDWDDIVRLARQTLRRGPVSYTHLTLPTNREV